MKIIISQHTAFTWGPGSMLSSYLKSSKKLLHISHPFDTKIDEPSFYQLYEDGLLTEEEKIGSTHTPIISYIKDFLITLFLIFKQKEKYNLFIGIDPLNAFTGLILKFFNKTDKVIFYPIDYSPIRFKNKLLNRFYHYIETYCVKRADSIWFLAQGLIDVFVENGANKDKCILTPIQIEKIYRNDLGQRFENPKLVYMGGLFPEKGVDLIVDAMPKILQKIPNIELIIIGGGPEEKNLQQKIKQLDIQKNIQMVGFVESRDETLKLLSECSIGIAPYVVDKDKYTGYGFGAKTIEYFSCGLPVIITEWQEIEQQNLGLTIKQSADDLANAVIILLSDKPLYEKCRSSCYDRAQEHYFKNVYDRAFATMGINNA